MWIGFVFEKRRIYYSGKLNPWGKFEDHNVSYKK